MIEFSDPCRSRPVDFKAHKGVAKRWPFLIYGTAALVAASSKRQGEASLLGTAAVSVDSVQTYADRL